MVLKSSRTRFGAVAIALHWITALLLVGALGSGFRAADTVEPSTKIQLLAIHIPLAVAAIGLTLVRIFWWLFVDKKPAPLINTPNWQHRGAGAVHLLFYIVILGMGVSGIGMFVLSGAGPLVFAGVEGQLPNFWEYQPRFPHSIGAKLFVALLIAHTGAALYHHFVLSDDLIWRMWFGKQN
ncbi:MAG: cytochrome b/b6 domain-containing protein [Pseudomonadota bacterium]